MRMNVCYTCDHDVTVTDSQYHIVCSWLLCQSWVETQLHPVSQQTESDGTVSLVRLHQPCHCRWVSDWVYCSCSDSPLELRRLQLWFHYNAGKWVYSSNVCLNLWQLIFQFQWGKFFAVSTTSLHLVLCIHFPLNSVWKSFWCYWI